MSTNDSTGQVLGASTALVSGIAVLPNTGDNILASGLALLAISLGVIVLASFVTSRLIKKFTR